MLQKTNKLLIGKDIARTAGVTSATTFAALILASTGIVAGEVVVLDKNKIPLAAGKTYADSDTIFICQGTSVTYSYTNPAGTAITARQLIMSDAIEGAKVRKYIGTSHVVKAEQVVNIAISGTVTAGVEYFVRIVYKDIPEHPGQFTQTYRVIANSTATATALNTQMATEINSHAGRRVNATDNTSATLTLTAREIASCCTGLTDIDDFSMVEFTPYYNYVTTAGNWATLANTTTYTTRADYGVGNWEQVRDLERSLLGYRGVQNKTVFPVITPVVDTVVDETYDIIIIEHDASYLSPDNQYRKDAPKQTTIALATDASQTTQILGVLNTWMASVPGAFLPVSV